MHKQIAYEIDGATYTGYLADDETRSGRRPAVLLCHQGGGLTEHTTERARMLSELGYVAFALDMYGKVASSMQEAMSWLQALVADPDELRKRAKAGLRVLEEQPNVDPSRIAAIGYCFGGGVVLELARCVPGLSCVVAFHPGLTGQPESDPRKVACKVMVCAGVDDPLIPSEARERFIALMKEAGADWQLLTYGRAGHSFTDRSVDAMNLPGFAYNEAADKRSWAAMLDLFQETMGRI
ncbi:MAG: dienelactone hydrolase family protein [Alphaproteobacteria bacterium]|nr:dienelactone hydrolase family protein [Alphaproteobacteria bacterium]